MLSNARPNSVPPAVPNRASVFLCELDRIAQRRAFGRAKVKDRTLTDTPYEKSPVAFAGVSKLRRVLIGRCSKRGQALRASRCVRPSARNASRLCSRRRLARACAQRTSASSSFPNQPARTQLVSKLNRDSSSAPCPHQIQTALRRIVFCHRKPLRSFASCTWRALPQIPVPVPACSGLRQLQAFGRSILACAVSSAAPAAQRGYVRLRPARPIDFFAESKSH